MVMVGKAVLVIRLYWLRSIQSILVNHDVTVSKQVFFVSTMNRKSALKLQLCSFKCGVYCILHPKRVLFQVKEVVLHSGRVLEADVVIAGIGNFIILPQG